MNLMYLEKTIVNSRHLVCLAGKNMMKGAGIRYLRDGDISYRTEQEYGYSMEELYNARVFGTRPELFYKFYKEAILERYQEPGPAFFALAELERMGMLQCVITREIYDLPRRAGCRHVFNLHGTIYDDNHCPRCRKAFPLEYVKNSGKVPFCDKCNLPLHPGTTLLGEMVDNSIMTKAADEISKADTLLLCGLSLGRTMAKEFLQYYQGDKLIVVNPEEHYYDSRADLIYHRELDELLPQVVKIIKDNR